MCPLGPRPTQTMLLPLLYSGCPPVCSCTSRLGGSHGPLPPPSPPRLSWGAAHGSRSHFPHLLGRQGRGAGSTGILPSTEGTGNMKLGSLSPSLSPWPGNVPRLFHTSLQCGSRGFTNRPAASGPAPMPTQPCPFPPAAPGGRLIASGRSRRVAFSSERGRRL